MDVTKPCGFTGFGAMDVTKPYRFIGFGAMDAFLEGSLAATWMAAAHTKALDGLQVGL